MKSDKFLGPDLVHFKVMQMCAQELTTPLTKMFNKSTDDGKVPTSWKYGNGTAIFKKGSKKQSSNYRPVSLTSVMCKLLQKLIRTDSMKHLDTNAILSDNQYGFRSKRSTTLQLLRVLDQWTELIDNGDSLMSCTWTSVKRLILCHTNA